MSAAARIAPISSSGLSSGAGMREGLRWGGLGLVLLLHVALLWTLLQHRILRPPAPLEPLFAHVITPPAPPQAEEPPKPQPPREVKLEKPRPIERPKPRQLVVEAPVRSPAEPVAPPPPPAPQVEAPVEAPPAPAPKPAGPITLSEELSVACPERTPPAYPASARRLGEQGRVLVRVELDERGQVSAARVAQSSGSARLDDAGLAAVRQWRCNPARRDGQPVRAVALQPFNFVLE
jgi:protein TonB